MRESSVRGPAIDLSEFERRMRSRETKPPAPKSSDPLSELARLMQGENAADPLGKILPDPRAAARPTPPPPPLRPVAPPPPPLRPAAPPPPQPSAAPPQWEAPLRGSYDAAPQVAPEGRYYEDERRAQAHYAPHQEPAHQEHGYAEPGYGQEDYGHGYHGGAEGGWADDSEYLDYGDDDSEQTPGGIRRFLKPWHAAAAIGVVAVISIAWGFLHRNGVGGSKEIAVITAPEGPVKVKPTAETDEDAPSKQGAAVLDRKEPTPVKQVVTRQEQAVDPSVQPKVVTLGDGPVDAPHEPPLGAQPRKVKTVTVRPDGSRADDVPLPPAAVENVEAPPVDAAPKGATPKPQTKPATTAQAPKPKPAPKVAAVEPPPAAGEEDGGAAAPSASSSGTYAVQFGAAGSEEEARMLLKSVSQKYGVRATFKPAKVGDKMVYRVRAAGLSKDNANAVCNKVKASGGNCFVAGN
jgi:hypothetical protein